MPDFDDNWRELEKHVSVDQWITRAPVRWVRDEVPEREGERGASMTAEEFSEFRRRGGKINYCAAQMAKQQLNDARHERRTMRHPLIDMVTEVVALWDPSAYLARQRAIVREILAKPRNARRRQLSCISTKERRHQQTIRLTRALAFNEISQAEYCRRHKLDKADASKMLGHLYDKEPGLKAAIDAISACVAATSWQIRQQLKIFHNKERAIRLEFGWNYGDVIDGGWLTDYSTGSIRSINSGRFKPTGLLRDIISRSEPFTPINLHEPDTWREITSWRELWTGEALVFADGHYCGSVDEIDWSRYHEPAGAVARYALLDEFRPISRQVQEKGKSRRKTWRIARAIQICDWWTRPLGYYPQHLRFLVPDIWANWGATDARYEALAVVGGDAPEDDNLPSGAVMVAVRQNPDDPDSELAWCPLAHWSPSEAEWLKVPMCRPAHSGQVVIGIDRGIKPDIELLWANYCRGQRSRRLLWSPRIVRKPSSTLIEPYTKRDWMVVNHEYRLATQLELKPSVCALATEQLVKCRSSLRLYFVSNVTPDTTSNL